MLRLAIDEDFDSAITNGLRLRRPDLDIVTVQQAGLARRPDADILDWAVSQGRLLLTHDARTMGGHFRDRVAFGKKNPGVVVVPQSMTTGMAIDSVELLAVASFDDEWDGVFVRLNRRTGLG